MTEIRKIAHLEYGDRFIWATDETRQYMNTVDGNDPNFQVLRCEDIVFNYNDYDNVHKLYFTRLDGTSDDLFFKDHHLVAIVDKETRVFDFSVLCDQCGRIYGDHFVGLNARLIGIHCHEPKSGVWFVPNERSLRQHAEFPENEFFESLGL